MTTHAQAPARPAASKRPTGWVPFALVALVVVPAGAGAGALRLVEVFGGPQLMPAKPRLIASPVPVYALALAAGTQTVTPGVGGAVLGAGALARDLSLVAGWVINLAVAEYVLRRRPRARPALRAGTP